jgi:hypothetical protein
MEPAGEETVTARTYATVIAIEVAVLVALWLAGRFFGAA